MKIKQVLMLATIILLVACGTKKKEIRKFELDSFKEVITLTGKAVTFEKKIYQPRDLVINDKQIFILDNDKAKSIHIYNREDISYVKSVLEVGKGPNETLGAWQLTVNRNNGDVAVLDVVKKSFFILSTDYNAQENLIKIKECFIPNHVSAFQGVYVNDSSFLVTGQNANNKRATLFSKNNTLDFGEFNYSKYRDVNETAIQFIYESRIGAKEDGERFVFVGRQINQIDIFDKAGENLISLEGPIKNKPLYEYSSDYIFWDKETVQFYELVRCTKNHFYLLYNENKYGSNKCGGNRILVFDWDGNPKYIIKLDKFIFSFDIDPSKNILYALIEFSENDYIVSYILPDNYVF